MKVKLLPFFILALFTLGEGTELQAEDLADVHINVRMTISGQQDAALMLLLLGGPDISGGQAEVARVGAYAWHKMVDGNYRALKGWTSGGNRVFLDTLDAYGVNIVYKFMQTAEGKRKLDAYHAAERQRLAAIRARNEQKKLAAAVEAEEERRRIAREAEEKRERIAAAAEREKAAAESQKTLDALYAERERLRMEQLEARLAAKERKRNAAEKRERLAAISLAKDQAKHIGLADYRIILNALSPDLNEELDKEFTGWVKLVGSNGQVSALVPIKDGEFHGTGFFWHENGRKHVQGQFYEGIKVGLNTEWYENGQKKKEMYYINGKEDGLGTFWYENGQKDSEGYYKEGKFDGLWTEWYEDGRLKKRYTFKDGELVD